MTKVLLKNKKKPIDKISAIVTVMTLISSVAILLSIISLGFIPDKYVVLLFFILLFLNLFFGFLGLSKRVNNLNKCMQIIICGLLSITMLTGSFMIPKYRTKIENIFISMQEVTELKISMYSLKTNTNTNITEFSGCTVGIHSTLDKEHVDTALDDINKLIEDDLTVVEYNNIFELIDSLYNEETDSILLNEKYVNLIADNEDYSDFLDKTNVIYTVTQEVANIHKSGFTGVVTKSPFIILIGGEDTYDYSNIGIDDKGIAIAGNRTDVNMVVIVNPITKQILIVTIPRDAYVAMYGDPDCMDKLTHASVISIENWINCVESVFNDEYKINFFYRVNFGSLVKLVNALGGIEVNNPYAFQSTKTNLYENGELVKRSFWFPEGNIELDGNRALAYVRERYNLPNGDISRNENTARVLKSIIRKATSPQVMSDIDNILGVLSGTFVTDMSFKQISALIKMQVNDMADWDIITKSITGSTGWGYSYLLGIDRIMSYLDDDSIEKVKIEISKIISGEILE